MPAPEEREEHSEGKFQPRYVQLHTLREHGHGRRNLVWGVVALFFAVTLLAAGFFLVGPRVVLALATCLLTFTALFVLARLHVFRQRNGGFLALGLICLFGAALPLLELGYRAIERSARGALASTAVKADAVASQEPTLLLTEAFALTPPDPNSGPRVKVLKDSRVPIDGKPYLIKAGDQFPFGTSKDGEVTFAVRDLLVALPADAVQIISDKASKPALAMAPNAVGEPQAPSAPAAEAPGQDASTAESTPAQLTRNAEREAIRRYPALGIKDSLENQMFVSIYREMRENGGDEFFQVPEWPLELAELLAKREKWVRGAPPVRVSSGPEPIAEGDPANRPVEEPLESAE